VDFFISNSHLPGRKSSSYSLLDKVGNDAPRTRQKIPQKTISSYLLTFLKKPVYWALMNKEIVMETVDFSQREVFTRHGGAFDRGSADAWYGRAVRPHYFTGATYQSTEIEEVDMSEEEIAAYMQGYETTPFCQKDYGVME